MTISRKIVGLVGAAWLVCGLVCAAGLYGLASVESRAGDVPALREALASARSAQIVALLIGWLFLGGLGFLLWRAIVQPIRRLEKVLAGAAETLDFTVSSPVPADSDEIGQAVAAWSRLQNRLRSGLAEIQQSLTHLLAVTEEVDQSSRRIARNSQVQSDASTNMAAAVEEMTVSISNVAEQAGDASKHTHESRDIAEQSASVILDTVSGIQQISLTVRDAAARIKALRSDCDSISSVAKIIREIADQTNLLALNAAIEAARAGEQGRGFAVVADEVRKLAERTTLSTQEITDLLHRMQESARLAVESMSHTESAVEERVGKAREAGESIEKIKQGADAAAVVVADISGAMKEQESASTSIARNIEQIAQMSEQNSAAANASAAGIGRVTQVGLAMTHSLAAFKLEAGEKKIVLRLADTHPDDHPATRAEQAMAEFLEQRSHGRITLKVINNGVFGAEKDELEQLKNGTLDMTRASAAMFNKDCPATVIPALPFIFNSLDHMHQVMDGAPGKEIYAACADAGYVGLGAFDSGSRCIFANKPVRSLADARDLKLRVMQSDLWIAVAKAMGTVPSPLAMEDILSGFRTGLIDAAEGNVPLFDGYKFHGACKYYSYTEHAFVPELLVFSKKRWDVLSPEDQALIAEAAREAVNVMRRLWREREEQARKASLAAGTTFIKDVNKESFRNAMRPVYDKFVTTPQQKALFQAIKGIR